jgi:DNA-binding transcriptional ArsR family regulator
MSRKANAAKANAGRSGLAGAAPLFAALGDETRLRMITRLGMEGPLSTVHLGTDTGVTRQAITKHLYALERAGLIDGTRGRPRVWRLRPQRLEDARRSLDRISQHWDEALSRLKTFVEE